MNTYALRFRGRLIGALGLTSDVYTEVQADSREAAARRAYDTHEHITRPIFVKGPTTGSQWSEENP